MKRYNNLKSIAFGFLAVLICAGMVMAAGETVNVSIGTLPAGKSITIIYDVMVNDPLPSGTTSVSQQGTVSGSNFSSVTDDPKTILVPLDATVTLLGNEPPVAGFGKALSFDGTNQYVVISDSEALSSSAYTVEAWVKFNTIQETAILQRLNAGNTTSAFGLFINGFGNFVHYADDGTLRTVTGTTAAEVGKWYHVAGIFDNTTGTMRLLVDGIEEGTPLTGIGSLIGTMDHFNIGKGFLSGRGANYLAGQIDEIRLWSAALSGSDILNWMYRGIDATNLNYSSLPAYYRLDDGTGNTATASKGLYNGVLQNMTNTNWVNSTINEWYTNENVAFSGKLVGSDADGASTNGTDWALTFELVADGTKGHVVIGADNNFTYTPNAGQSGDDTFTYKVKDSVPQDSNAFTVTVHIAPVPDAPMLTKTFGAPGIPLNATTTLTFTVSNPDLITSLSGIAFSDTLPAGLVIGSPAVVFANCVGTITAPEGFNLISMTVNSLAANTSCNFVVNVTGTTAGTKNNTTSIVTSNESVPGGTASASINVVAPPVITKAFGAPGIPLNGTTSLTFTITNPAANTVALNQVAFTDLLPPGLVAIGDVSNTCTPGLSVVGPPGSPITQINGVVPVNSSCTIVVIVQGTISGNWTNITSPVFSLEGGIGNAATANLAVATPPVITKAFGAAGIPLNGSTSLTFTITNPGANTIPLTGLAFTDNLPAGMVVSTPNNLTNTCGGTASVVAGSSLVNLSGVTLASNTFCTLSVNVTGTTAGVKNNSVQVTSIEGGIGNTSNASIMVVAPPVIIKAFGAASIPLNGSTSLSFTIQNNNTATTLSSIGFNDTLPAGMVVSSPSVVSGSCGGGTITAIAGTNFISMTGATLAASSSCTFSVNVTGTTVGAKNNTTGNVTSNQGGTGGTASASLDVIAPPSIAKAFGAASIPLNNTTSLTFTITNPAVNAVAETGVAFTDSLPAGMVVATPPAMTNTCGGIVTAVAGSGSISLTNGTVAVNSSCTLAVNVTGTTAGTKNNVTGNVSSTNGGTGGTASASISVATPPVIVKAFGAPSIPLNGSTSLTFTINNLAVNTIPLTGIAFTDNLPGGLIVSTPNNLLNTCGGTATAVASSSSVSLSGATLAINSSCTLSVNVTGTTPGVKNNSVTVSSNEGGIGNTSNASITVVAPPVIAKLFGTAKILLNGATPLSFTIQNTNNVTALIGVGFSDTLLAGLVVSTPNGLSGTCGGGTIAATDGSGTVSLSGATLAALTSCTFSVNVTGTTAGVKDNSVTVTSTNGGTGNISNASLTVVGPPIATAATDITKISFSANWNASVGATGYRLDVATDAGFSSFVTGFNNLDVGNVTTYSVASGLVSGKAYYYRVRAYFPGSTTGNSNTIKLTTIGGKMSRNSWYLTPEGWIVRAYTKADAPNEVYLEVIDTGNVLVNPSSIAGMTSNPKLIASDATAPEVALGFNKATRTAHVTYTSAAGRQVVSVPGIRQAP